MKELFEVECYLDATLEKLTLENIRLKQTSDVLKQWKKSFKYKTEAIALKVPDVSDDSIDDDFKINDELESVLEKARKARGLDKASDSGVKDKSKQFPKRNNVRSSLPENLRNLTALSGTGVILGNNDEKIHDGTPLLNNISSTFLSIGTTDIVDLRKVMKIFANSFYSVASATDINSSDKLYTCFRNGVCPLVINQFMCSSPLDTIVHELSKIFQHLNVYKKQKLKDHIGYCCIWYRLAYMIDLWKHYEITSILQLDFCSCYSCSKDAFRSSNLNKTFRQQFVLRNFQSFLRLDCRDSIGSKSASMRKLPLSDCVPRSPNSFITILMLRIEKLIGLSELKLILRMLKENCQHMLDCSIEPNWVESLKMFKFIYSILIEEAATNINCIILRKINGIHITNTTNK